MLADIGLMALVMGFLLAVYATAVSAWGRWHDEWRWVESARNASLLTVPFLTISVLIVVYSLLAMDFSLAYVVDVSSRAMSPFLRLTALWGGQSGSVLFWAWC